MSRAFDSVDFEFVKYKLDSIGIRGNILDFIISFLSDRTAAVSVNGVRSVDFAVTDGVAQGSVLGPLIFVLFINDLPDHLGKTLVVNYADDTSVGLAAATPEELSLQMNLLISTFRDWCYKNKLMLNTSKTQCLYFKRNVSHITNIEGCDGVNFLGIRLDHELNFINHIDYVISKLSTAYYAILQLKYEVSSKHLIDLYYSLVYPYLAYNVALWGNSIASERVFINQKRIIRLMFNLTPRQTCRDTFVSKNTGYST